MRGRCRRLRRRLEPEVSPFARTSAISPTSTRCSPRSSGSFGHLDGVFVNAGYSEFLLFEDVTEQSFDKVIAVNFKGAYFTIQKALPLLRQGSSVIINASVTARKGWPTTSAVSACKAAVVISLESSAPTSWAAGFA